MLRSPQFKVLRPKIVHCLSTMAAHERADDDKGDDEAALRIVFPQLVEELQADNVIDDLYQRNLLTKNEYREIVDASSKEESKTTNRRILMAVSRRPAGFVPVLANILSKKYSSMSNALEKGERRCVPIREGDALYFPCTHGSFTCYPSLPTALADATSLSQIDPATPQQPAMGTSFSSGVTGVG